MEFDISIVDLGQVDSVTPACGAADAAAMNAVKRKVEIIVM
jgi:hypothetical protein